MGWQDDAVIDEPKVAEKAWQKDIVVKAAPLPSVEEFRAAKPAGEPAWQRALPAAGAIVGGLAGLLSPVPGGAAVGAVVGTAAGASIGTSGEQIIRSLSGDEPSRESARLGPNESRTALMLNEQLGNVTEQTALEVLGQGVGRVANAGVRAISPEVRPGAAAAQAALQARGGSLSAAQAVDSPALNIAESFARSGAGGKGKFDRLAASNTEAINSLKNDIVSGINAAPVSDRAAGKLFQSAIENGSEAHQAASSALYKDFDQKVAAIGQPAIVPMTESKAFTDSVGAQYARNNVKPDGRLGEVLGLITNAPANRQFSDVAFLRSQVNSIKRDLESTASPDSRALGAARKLVGTLDKDMEVAARNLPGNLHSEYRNVAQFYAKGKAAFNNDVIVGLLSQDASKVGEKLFANGNVEPILQAKASVRQAVRNVEERNIELAAQGQPLLKPVDQREVLSRLQAGFLEAKLTASTMTSATGDTTAVNLLKSLSNSKTDRTMTAMFTPTQRASIENFANTAYMTMKNKPESFGVLTSMLQASAIVTLGSAALLTDNVSGAGAIGGAVATLLAPNVLARVLTNPKAVNVLIRGLELGPKAQASPAVMAKLVSGLNEAMKEGD